MLFQTLWSVIVILCRTILQRHLLLLQWVCVLYLVAMATVAVLIGTVATVEGPSMYYAPFLIVLSMAFALPIWLDLSLLTITTVAFLILSYLHKSMNVFQMDVSIAIVALCLSIVCDLEVLDLRQRDYQMRCDLMEQTRTDSLTGLLNKTTTETAARNLLGPYGHCESATLFVIDLDQFKQINDRMGHQAGDIALEMVGAALLQLFRANDIVGRIGGDEFMALIINIDDVTLMERRAVAICDAARSIRLPDYPEPLTCSVGVAMCPVHGKTYESLFSEADKQLYLAKDAGRNTYKIAD